MKQKFQSFNFIKMGFFSKLKPKQKDAETAQPAQPQQVTGSRKASASTFELRSQPEIPRVKTRASQPSFLQPIKEQQDELRTRNNSSRASRHRARDVTRRGSEIEVGIPQRNPVPGPVEDSRSVDRGTEIIHFQEIVETQDAEIDKLKRELGSCLQRLRRSDALRIEARERQVEELDMMAREISSLRGKLDEQEAENYAEVRKFKIELREKNAIVTDCLQRVKISDTLRNEAKVKSDRMKSCMDSLSLRLEERNMEIEQKNSSIHQLEGQVEDAKRTASAKQEGLRRSEREMVEMRQRLEDHLSQKEHRIGELEQQVRENINIIEETGLTLNRTRNELNEERRKARQVSGENADKARQLEFVQQQCASLQEKIGGMKQHWGQN